MKPALVGRHSMDQALGWEVSRSGHWCRRTLLLPGLLPGLLASICAIGAAAATVSGRVVLTGPEQRAPRNPDASGVVVWLEPAGAAEPRPAAAVPKRAVMQQRNKTFLPHVLGVEVGTAVDFPNLDPIFHNAFSNYEGQVFDVNLYAPQTSRRVVFRRPGMVRIFCNIHATMSAVIAVLPTPYFAVTGPDGRFQVQAPAGAYRFKVWHERSQAEILESLGRSLSLSEEPLNLAEIRLSEQGFLASPHKNKYGRDYPARREEHVFYPGGPR